MRSDANTPTRLSRGEALRFLRLLEGTSRDDIASVCDMWAAAFTLRMAAAPDENIAQRYRRLAQRLRDARFVLLGDSDPLLDERIEPPELHDTTERWSDADGSAAGDDAALAARPAEPGPDDTRIVASPAVAPERIVAAPRPTPPRSATGRRRRIASVSAAGAAVLAMPMLLLAAVFFVALRPPGGDPRGMPNLRRDMAEADADATCTADAARWTTDTDAAWGELLVAWRHEVEHARTQAVADAWLAEARRAGWRAMGDARAFLVRQAKAITERNAADRTATAATQEHVTGLDAALETSVPTAAALATELSVNGDCDATESRAFEGAPRVDGAQIELGAGGSLSAPRQQLVDVFGERAAAFVARLFGRGQVEAHDPVSAPPDAASALSDVTPPAYSAHETPYELAGDARVLTGDELVLSVSHTAENGVDACIPGGFPLSADEARARQARDAAALGVAVERRIRLARHVEMDLVLIPSGEFVMGSPDGEEGRYDDEGPQRRVRITRAFYIGECEVTQAQWRAVMGTTQQSWFKGDQLPVESVTALDCQEFCRRLSQSSALRVRLPTEAEWEYACRAGTGTPFAFGGVISAACVSFDGSTTYGGSAPGLGRDQPTPVGSFEPNAWGIHDMHGNVWEWCGDWYGRYPETTEVSDPSGPASGEYRVLRGGSWGREAALCRSAARVRTNPAARSADSGFRVVVEAE